MPPRWAFHWQELTRQSGSRGWGRARRCSSIVRWSTRRCFLWPQIRWNRFGDLATTRSGPCARTPARPGQGWVVSMSRLEDRSSGSKADTMRPCAPMHARQLDQAAIGWSWLQSEGDGPHDGQAFHLLWGAIQGWGSGGWQLGVLAYGGSWVDNFFVVLVAIVSVNLLSGGRQLLLLLLWWWWCFLLFVKVWIKVFLYLFGYIYPSWL